MTKRKNKMSIRPQFVTLESRVNPASAFALAGATIIPFDTDFPSLSETPIAVTNLGAGETLAAIDLRPQNGHLYGLTSNGTGGVRLYDISPRTGKATPLTAAPVTFTDDIGAPVAVGGTRFEIDFNPTVDRLRIVSDTGINFRMNPNNGTIVDGNAALGINPDGNLNVNGAAATGGGTAYTNSFINTSFTTQYTIDTTTKQLFIQNPPNNGTLTNGVLISSDGTNPVNFTAFGGFDIPSSVSVAASNDKANGNGFAIFTVGGKTQLYTINLSSGQATAVSTIGDGSFAVTGIAVSEARAGGAPAFALDGAATLIRFESNTPGTTKSIGITGVLGTETLVGIDIRPATGQFIGLGVDSTSKTGSIYLIDPQLGTASLLVAGTQSAVAFVTAGGTAVDLPAGGYGLDFNPTVDRIRVVTSSGLNFRLNPTNGLPVDGDAVANGNNPDGGINGPATGVSGTAYTNAFGGATVTTQYTLDSVTKSLYIQNAPNSGTQTLPVPVTLNGAALDFTSVNGFDIPASVQVTTGNTPATGSALAGLTVGGASGLYRINLATGAATLVGALGTSIGGFTVADDFSARSFKLFAAGTGLGIANSVAVYNPDGSVRYRLTPYEASFTGGVYVATGDVNGDGIDDIITGTGKGGGPLVKIFNGATGAELSSFFAYENSFRGGVTVAAGDTNGDGRADVITGTGPGGGPRVRVLSGTDNSELANYFAYEDSFRGGVLVGAGDVNGDGLADVITGTGVGGGPRVRALSGATTTELANFFAYEPSFRGGVFVAGGNVAGSATAEIITGTGVGGGPRVIAFETATFTPVADFFAFAASFRGGVSVGAVNRLETGTEEIIVGSGSGIANTLRLVTAANTPVFSTNPFDVAFLGGISVG